MRIIDKQCAYKGCRQPFQTTSKFPTKKYCTHKCSTDAMKGKPKSLAMRSKLSAYGAKHCVGKKLSPEHAAKVRVHLKKFQSGPGHWAWKGGVTPKQRTLRFTKRYTEWRKSVFERDGYTCVLCGQLGGKLNADHFPKSFRDCFYEEDFDAMHDLNNGRTLCITCHQQTPNFGIKGVRV